MKEVQLATLCSYPKHYLKRYSKIAKEDPEYILWLEVNGKIKAFQPLLNEVSKKLYGLNLYSNLKIKFEGNRVVKVISAKAIRYNDEYHIQVTTSNGKSYRLVKDVSKMTNANQEVTSKPVTPDDCYEVLDSFEGYEEGNKLIVDPNTNIPVLRRIGGKEVTILRFVDFTTHQNVILNETPGTYMFSCKDFIKTNYSTGSKESNSISYDLSRITDTKPGSEGHSSSYERSRTKPSFTQWDAPQQSKGYSCSRRKAGFSTI